MTRPSRAVRAPRKRAGALAWPVGILGEPSTAEQQVFELLASGMSQAAGGVDGLQLATIARNVLILKAAQERLARAGTLIRTKRGSFIANPDIVTVTSLSGVVLRGLQACGLSPILLDRAPKVEGGDDDLGEGSVDDAGIFWPADGSPGYFVGKTEQKSAKVVRLKPKAAK